MCKFQCWFFSGSSPDREKPRGTDGGRRWSRSLAVFYSASVGFVADFQQDSRGFSSAFSMIGFSFFLQRY